MPEQRTAVTLALVSENDDDLLQAVVDLADQHRSTLGLMPRGAFPELAAQGGLLAATDGTGSVAGYALFSVARGRVRLIHLCVANTHRRQGTARVLVRRISQLHPDAAGIALRCRRDYGPAMALWPMLGFTPTGETPGRGREGTILTSWWLSHNIPDLFSASEGEGTVAVAIDHNVFVDLALEPNRPGAEESRWLRDDWLPESVALKVTKVSGREAIKNTNARDRRRQLNALSVFPSLEYGPNEEDAAAARWNKAVPDVPLEDRADCAHLISAAAGGARIFVTRDDLLIRRYSDHAEEVFGIRVIRPSELVMHLDELTNATRYQPVAMEGTNYTVSTYGAGAEKELDTFLAHRAGEHKSAYHRILRSVAGDPAAQRWWVHDPAGRLVAAWAFRPQPAAGALEVPFLRIADTPVGATLGRLVAFQLRHDALRSGMRSVLVTDPALNRDLFSDLVRDGYRPVANGLEAPVLDVRNRRDATVVFNEAHPLHHVVNEAVASASSRDRVAALERTLWPAKFFDTDMPSYIVPIQPRWARPLLALTPTLWSDAGLLGLSREHVYYRTPRANPFAPARIAWYASSSGGDRISSVVAVSLLVKVDTAPPEVLFRRYRRLGVYRRNDLASAEREGVASALRFVDTEKFVRQVPLERLRALSGGCLTSTLQSPTMITSELFGAIYAEGTRRAR